MIMERESDIIIIGAGIIGSSIAYHLSQRTSKNIIVLDIDLNGRWSASELNAGGVRAEWWHEVNVSLSKATIDFLETAPDLFGFRQKGYLWLYDEKSWKAYQSHKDIYGRVGLDIRELTPKAVNQHIPYIDRLEGISGATLSQRDGIINPNLLKQHYRNEALQKGVTFIDGAHVTKIEKNKTKKIKVTYEDIRETTGKFTETGMLDLLSKKIFSLQGPLKNLEAEILINAAGVWASGLAKGYGHEVHCEPVRRQISIFDCKELDLSPYGMIVDTSGVYFHAEASHILAGYATPGEPTGYNYRYDGDLFFETYIWPNLMRRMSRAEALKHLTGWAGHYSQTPDRSGIMGKVDAEAEIYEAHSFTGRGVMQSYGVGLALSELILNKRYDTIDASGLHPDRFRNPKGKLLYEGFHI